MKADAVAAPEIVGEDAAAGVPWAVALAAPLPAELTALI